MPRFRSAIFYAFLGAALLSSTPSIADVLLEDAFSTFELGVGWKEHDAGAPDAALTSNGQFLEMRSTNETTEFRGIETLEAFPLSNVETLIVDARLRPINTGAEGSIAAAEVAIIGANGKWIRAFTSNNAGPDPDFINDWGDHYLDAHDNQGTSGPWPHCTDKGGPGCDAMRNFVLTLTLAGVTIDAYDDNSAPGEPRWQTSFDTFTIRDLGASFTLALRQQTVEGGDEVIGFFDHVRIEATTNQSQLGDFDRDGDLDVSDLDSLTAQVRQNTHNLAYDLTNDGQVTSLDRDRWVDELKHTFYGDANLDGEFNSSDFVIVFIAGTYEDLEPSNATWGTGDWDGDGDFTSSDFVIAFQAGGYERGPRPATGHEASETAASVPEPTSISLFVAGLVIHAIRARYSRSL